MSEQSAVKDAPCVLLPVAKIKHIEDLQRKLDDEHRNALAALSILQEEVFLLRDEVSALADHADVVLISESGGTRVIPKVKQRSKNNE